MFFFQNFHEFFKNTPTKQTGKLKDSGTFSHSHFISSLQIFYSKFLFKENSQIVISFMHCIHFSLKFFKDFCLFVFFGVYLYSLSQIEMLLKILMSQGIG